MIESILLEITIMMAVGLLVAGIVSTLKQPLIIGYIAAGIILGPLLNVIHTNDAIAAFAQLGVVILLFTVGLNLSPKVFREVGKVSILTGLGQIVFTSIIGFFISHFLGYSIVASLYIAIALTFSSTIIIMKILADKEDVDTLYGKISIGFLLVQDVAAMLILAAVSSFSATDSSGTISIFNFLLIFAVTAALVPISVYILPKITKKIAKSQEYLLLFSIGWCLILATLFYEIKFSMEIGALLAGVTLSTSIYRYEITSKIKPIRDFFIFLFFIHLGSQMSFANLDSSIIPIIVFSAFILIGNPIIVLFIMGRLGYTKKTGFLAGLTVAQISEFSLILIALGVKTGSLSSEILSMVTIVGLITITGSTYAMIYADKIFPYLSGILSVFEKKKVKHEKVSQGSRDILLFGYDKVGFSLLKSFRKMGWKYLLIDFNPEIIKFLKSINATCMYGDAEDVDMLDELRLHKSKMVVSTIPDYCINSLILKKVRENSDETIVILVCNSIEDSLKLYEQGATYVIIPRLLGGTHASMLIEKYGFNLDKFIKEKAAHLEHIGDRKTIKHFGK